MFEPLTDLPAGVIGFEGRRRGHPRRLTDVFIPAIDDAAKRGKIRLVFVLGERYTGFTSGVVWEKAKMRVEHFGAWDRCALVTDIEWITHVVGLLHWLMPGTLKVFPTAELDAAKVWAAG